MPARTHVAIRRVDRAAQAPESTLYCLCKPWRLRTSLQHAILGQIIRFDKRA